MARRVHRRSGRKISNSSTYCEDDHLSAVQRVFAEETWDNFAVSSCSSLSANDFTMLTSGDTSSEEASANLKLGYFPNPHLTPDDVPRITSFSGAFSIFQDLWEFPRCAWWPWYSQNSRGYRIFQVFPQVRHANFRETRNRTRDPLQMGFRSLLFSFHPIFRAINVATRGLALQCQHRSMRFK